MALLPMRRLARQKTGNIRITSWALRDALYSRRATEVDASSHCLYPKYSKLVRESRSPTTACSANHRQENRILLRPVSRTILSLVCDKEGQASSDCLARN